jgi:hypothetical protein
MTDVVPGGRRRIDRILDPGFLSDLAELPTDELRDHIAQAEAEYAELGEITALLDERSAMVLGEQRRRIDDQDSDEDGPALAESPRRLARVFGLRATPEHRTTQEHPPTRRKRRRVERLVCDVDLSDIRARTDDELARVLRTFRHEQRLLADVHARVRAVVARCTDELNRRGATRATRTSRGGATGKLRGLADRSSTASR